jgi:hypothetical protein
MKNILFIIGVLFITSCGKNVIDVNDIDNTSLLIKDDTCYCFIPSAFSPDGNAINDLLQPIYKGLNAAGYELIIRDKRQNEIFRTTDINQAWDGKDNGKKAKAGQYIATVKGQLSCGASFDQHFYVCSFLKCVIPDNEVELKFADMFDPILVQTTLSTQEGFCP